MTLSGTLLSEQLQRLRTLRAAQVSNAKIVEPAVPGVLVTTAGERRTPILGIVVGLLLAIGAVVAAESFDYRRIPTPAAAGIISGSTSLYLAPILPVIAAARQGLPLQLVTVGAEVALQAPWLPSCPWSLARQAEDLVGFDIGIMPLPDSSSQTAAALSRYRPPNGSGRCSICSAMSPSRGAAGHAFVHEHYSYRRWAPELAALLRSVAS